MTTIKKYALCAGLGATMLLGAGAMALAQDNSHASASVQSKMVVEINPSGQALVRGTVKSVGSSSLVLTTWGGDWTINVTYSTKIMPIALMSQFHVGDYVGVHGKISQTAGFTIDATLVRDWTVGIQSSNNKEEVKNLIYLALPHNWQGVASNVNNSGSLTLTVNDSPYLVNISAGAKIVNQHYGAISLSDIKSGDTVRVWGSVSGTTITALIVRDISLK